MRANFWRFVCGTCGPASEQHQRRWRVQSPAACRCKCCKPTSRKRGSSPHTVVCQCVGGKPKALRSRKCKVLVAFQGYRWHAGYTHVDTGCSAQVFRHGVCTEALRPLSISSERPRRTDNRRHTDGTAGELFLSSRPTPSIPNGPENPTPWSTPRQTSVINMVAMEEIVSPRLHGAVVEVRSRASISKPVEGIQRVSSAGSNTK